jgi:hypothetical protein
MELFGKRISKWWLLVVVVAGVVCLPLILIGFFAANNLAGAILGPPAIWNRTWQTPPREDLVGSYEETHRRVENQIEINLATLSLEPEGSMVVSGLPYEFYPNTCLLSGKGTWSGPHGDDRSIDLTVVSDQSSGSCTSGSYSFLELTGHSKPYTLYWVIGDPDSGTGVWLSKK